MAEVVDFPGKVEAEVEMVVLVDDLAPILEHWLAREQARYEQENTTANNGQDARISPLDYVAFHAKTTIRTINSILSRERTYVNIDLADLLLLAIDRFLWEVEVYPKQEVHLATMEQRELVAALCRAKGIHVDRKNRNWAQKARRHLHLIQGGKA